MDFLNASDEILSVGEFSRRLKTLFKIRVPELWLRGEVSNVRVYSSGHTYFTLKDADASISAVLFKGYASNAPFTLQDGMKVLLFGEVSVYELRGTYQLVVKAMMPDGVGDLAKRFEELKRKLSQEGLFDASRKIAIPELARKIAVITSPSGAAVRDFIRILTRRNWRGEVYILPSKVQGADAPAEIVSQLKFANSYVFADGSRFDLIVLTRGGGSLEDLFAFSDEGVARAVAAAELPVISAVGHEIDFSLADFAADLRAETPSAAAELISSSYLDCVSRFRDCDELLTSVIARKFDDLRARLTSLADMLRLNSPEGKINAAKLRLDEVSARFEYVVFARLSSLRLAVSECKNRLSALSPESKISFYTQKLVSLEKQLDLLSVDGTLRRGFALVLNSSGEIVPSSDKLGEGDFTVRFHDGEIGATRI